MTTWFTADLHLGHRNIIDYCSRPFADVDAMNVALIERWNEVVAADDTVWVVGDFALGKLADTLPLVDLLHGRKVLVAGNHDRCWDGHGRRADGWTERYLDAGFDEVRQGSTRIDIDGTSVVMCHFPYRSDSQRCDRVLDRMHTKRLPAYATLGFDIPTNRHRRAVRQAIREDHSDGS